MEDNFTEKMVDTKREFGFLKKLYSKENEPIKEKYEKELNEWISKREIIIITMKLDDYLKDNSPLKFLNFKAKSFVPLGSLWPTAWGIRHNKDKQGNDIKDEYKVSSNYKTGKEVYKENEAEEFFNKNICPLWVDIKNVFENNNATISMLANIQNGDLYEKFPGKQLLIKMMFMESAREECPENLKHMLPFISKPETINKIFDKIISQEDVKKHLQKAEDEELTTVEKAYIIMDKCYKNLKDKDTEIKPSLEEQIKISNILWRYAEVDMLDVDEKSPNVIYYGSPGTGKTYTVNEGIDLRLKGDENERKKRVVNVQCHPGFGYEEFIEGLKPVGIEDGKLKLEIVNGAFKELCIRARDDLENEYYFVADEINRANLSAMFGETLSLLEVGWRDFREENGEPKRQTVKTPLSKVIEAYFNNKISEDGILDKIKKEVYECDVYFNENDYKKLSLMIAEGKTDRPHHIENVEFGIPKNIRFIGMMNDVDKNIDAFDLALRRRFKWIRKDCDYGVLKSYLHSINSEIDDGNINTFVKCCENLNKFISSNDNLGFGKTYEFGHAYFMRIGYYLDHKGSSKNIISKSDREKLFNEHLKPVLTEYIRSFMEENMIENKIKDAYITFVDGN